MVLILKTLIGFEQYISVIIKSTVFITMCYTAPQRIETR